MVSTDRTSVAPFTGLVPAVPKQPAPFCARSNRPSFPLSDVTVNYVAVDTLDQLLYLGNNRALDTAESRTNPVVRKAFPGDSREEHDIAYFGALLGAQRELREELRNKIKGLLSMRRRNNKLEKRRLKRHLASFNSGRGAWAANNPANNHDSEATVMAGKAKGSPGFMQDSCAGSGVTSTETTFTHGSDHQVQEGWPHVQDHTSICSSPSSPGMPSLGKIYDVKRVEKKLGAEKEGPEESAKELEVASRH